MRLVVLTLAALCCAGPVFAQGIIVPCGDPSGAWTWQLGGTVRFDENTATWSPSADSDAVFSGR